MAKKVTDPAIPGPDHQLIMVYIGFATLGTLWVALQLGNLLAVTKQHIPVNPIAIVIGLVKGQIHWPLASTAIVLLVIAAYVAYRIYKQEKKKRAGKGKLAIDDKAQHMGNGGAIAALTEAGVREKAVQLGQTLGEDDEPGVPIGISVADGCMIYGSYEDLQIDIWGPRQGKSTSRVIPAILSAIGPVLVTSNKRDVVDATRDVREAKGSPVFVFDPTGVANEEPRWYWDPLAWVDPRHEGAEMRAARLAGHFADGDSGSDARDSFFDPEAEDLLAGLFLAAAMYGKPITQVWEWVTNPLNPEPVEVLRAAGDHFGLSASGLSAQYNVDPRTRSGIFGTAKKMVRCLKLSNVHNWVQPGTTQLRDGGTVTRIPFDELNFIEDNGTLYSLSLEGRGSAGPLVSALTEAIIDVAMRRASRSYGGRLPVPLLAVLDEAANVVRWKDLPKQYSHFGSRGIVVMTVLQSWAQGVRCWGEAGMEALWSAANIKVIGSGIDDTQFLAERSEAIGDYEVISQSMSESKGGKSYSRSLSSSRTFNVNALITLPRGRVIVFTSGAPAVLVRTVPWWEGEYAEAVRRSIERHNPARRTDMNDLIAQRELITASSTEEPGAPAEPYYGQPQHSGQPEEVRPL
ncbi:TraM recognition domain-containing protein [Nocardia sp. alder85J]|uniref:TraM recognition domain-containing protein n=1 Tax=Nocardia sp. alder85J TaxID=2862949 RepID=UPI001CD57A0E|nr:TraM recognition domain-containing protein [Nocardia sp. alder85J]MCX4091162.1 TraM recognition domain-containing protein [Nocardia sp. alder85J]